MDDWFWGLIAAALLALIIVGVFVYRTDSHRKTYSPWESLEINFRGIGDGR